MKVSEITNKELVTYLKLDPEVLTVEEVEEIDQFLDIAKKYIMSYTGLTTTEVDSHEDFIIVVYVLVEDMYDNRVMYVDKNNMNKVIESILGMHAINLL